jgi:hypothetical protein
MRFRQSNQSTVHNPILAQQPLDTKKQIQRVGTQFHSFVVNIFEYDVPGKRIEGIAKLETELCVIYVWQKDSCHRHTVIYCTNDVALRYVGVPAQNVFKELLKSNKICLTMYTYTRVRKFTVSVVNFKLENYETIFLNEIISG